MPKWTSTSVDRHTSRARLLAGIATRLLMHDKPDEIAHEVFASLAVHLDLDLFVNYMVSDDGTRLRLAAYEGLPEEEAASIATLGFDESVCGTVAARRQRMVLDLGLISTDPIASAVHRMGVTAYACHPLIGGEGRLIGTLSFGSRRREAFAEEELELMETVANQVAVAVDRARLLADARRELRERRQAEASLRESEDNYRRLFEHTAEGFFLAEVVVDDAGEPADYRYLAANLAFEELTGLKREAIIGRTVKELLPEAEPQWIETYGRVALTGEPARLDSFAKPLGRWFSTVAYCPRPGRFACVFSDVTERRRAEEALRRGQLDLQRFFESGIVGVIHWNTDGGITDANDRFLRTIGYTRDDLEAGRVQWTRLTPPEYRDRDEYALGELRTRGVDTPYEKEFIRKDGSRVPIIVGAAMLDENRSDGVGFVLDISDRKRADEALRQSEAALQRERSFLRTVIDSLSSLVTVTDASGLHLLANEAAARFHGMSVHELQSKRLDDLRTAVAGAREQNERVLASGKGVLLEIDAVGADGVLHSFITTKTPLANDAGAYDRILTTAVDITWRKRAERALRDSEARFREQANELRTVLDAVPAAVFITHDPDGRQMEGNRFTETYLHLPTRRNVSMSAPPEERPTTFRPMRNGEEIPADELPLQTAARTRAEVRDYEFDVVFADGSKASLLGNAAPLVDDQGNARGAVGAFVDVTALKRAEQALARANAQLAEDDRRKDEFIAVLSHELRNPLAPIRYALPLLQRERLSAPGARAVSVIDRQLHHLTTLVDDLLDVSRITGGKIKLHREQLTIGSVVNAAAEAASPAITTARHALHLVVPDDPIWLHADPARLAQVLTNLLNNAAKYTPPGGRIALVVSQEGDRAVVEVTDNGIGIEAEALPTIFEMFRQAHAAPDTGGARVAGPVGRSQGGLGIGLALAKRLVEMHGGTIEAYSEGAGRGARFVVRLPVATEAGTAEAEHEAAPSPERRRPLRVLVVDDNADLVEMLGTLVATLGHDVRKALDGRSALSAATRYRPDVVLLDLGLPDMSGLEVARSLKREPDTASARLVALTGWGQTEDRRQTRDAGFDDHLTKPTDPSEIERLLGRIAGEVAN